MVNKVTFKDKLLFLIMEKKRTIGVGIGVMLLKDDKVLLGLRNPDPEKADSRLHGEGTWTMPGGKIHFGERWRDAAYREVFEETGIRIDREKLSIVCVNDDILPDVHFVTIGLLCRDFKGKPKVKEPEEILEWKWFKLDTLPKNLYLPSKKVIETYLKNSKGFKSLGEIEDFYVDLGYRGNKLRMSLSEDKEYQRLLKERKQKLTKQFKATLNERKKYVLSTSIDFEILGKCKQLEKLNLSKEDKFLVELIKAQLEYDWRKSLTRTLDKLLKKYKQK